MMHRTANCQITGGDIGCNETQDTETTVDGFSGLCQKSYHFTNGDGTNKQSFVRIIIFPNWA